jgi:hypothetical protein
MTIPFPDQRPDQCLSFLWRLQNLLLAVAEQQFGPRADKKIYQPTFSAKGPRIINTPSLDGAFADLSLIAGGDWPVTVFELAHETVHLVDPVLGCTNYLEEGVAVEFSVIMSQLVGGRRQEPSLGTYLEAWQLARQLHGGVFESAKKVRSRCGSLGKVGAADLLALFPDRDGGLLEKLVQQWIPVPR